MTAVVLDVGHIGKCYSTYDSNLKRFATWFGAKIAPTAQFWAVEDIAFQLTSGQSLALIGQNGAGKSTLLKLITGTIRPSRGTVGVNGTISAILELGLGFNPEFTGRQNAFHAGGLMGMSQGELADLMPEIERFAEIGAFFDQPFRVYSSGMQARLAFALATAKRPDVLIVDEVLSVGDSYFQHKSFDRIREFKEQGTSIVIVTHAMGDVRALCDRVILIDKGRVVKDGDPDEVVDHYNALIALKENQKLNLEQQRETDGWMRTRSGSYEITTRSIALMDAATGEPVSTAIVGQDLLLRVEAVSDAEIASLVLGFMLRDRTGHVVWGTNTWHTDQVVDDVKIGETIVFEMRFRCQFGQGSYSFSTALASADTHLDRNFEWSDNVLVFDVLNTTLPYFLGTMQLTTDIKISR